MPTYSETLTFVDIIRNTGGFPFKTVFNGHRRLKKDSKSRQRIYSSSLRFLILADDQHCWLNMKSKITFKLFSGTVWYCNVSICLLDFSTEYTHPPIQWRTENKTKITQINSEFTFTFNPLAGQFWLGPLCYSEFIPQMGANVCQDEWLTMANRKGEEKSHRLERNWLGK